MDTRIRYMAMARENEKIINQGVYEAGREVFHFASPLSRLEEAEIYGPKVLEEMVSSLSAPLGEGRISVVEGDTLAYGAEGVLNFANAFTPGGGYLYGASSQEEALCRASLLYYTIRTVKDFYNANRLHVKPDYTHGMIYSSGVPIIRQNDGTLLDVPQQCDFITCPAVNRTYAKAMFPQDVLDRTMQERITQIILLAAREHPDVLVLGAFGCGVFGNKREVVYPMFEDAINRYLPEDITVIFADPRGIS